MTRNVVLIVMGILFSSIAMSQNSKMMVHKIPLQELGRSSLTVYYQYVENKGKKLEKEGVTGLQLMNSKSRFFDVFGDRFIERHNALDNKELNPKDFQELVNLEKQDVFKKTIFKDFSTSTVLVQSKIIGKKLQYEEPIPKIKWKFVKETKEILGYSCQKATTTFRGRKYEAWFAEELPVSDGPFLFTGLPGLILEVRDVKDEYVFVATGMETKKEAVYLELDPAIIKTDRASYRRADQNHHIDPGAALQGKIYSEPGKVMNTSGMKAIPYNPIELE